MNNMPEFHNKVMFDENARDKISKGVNLLADTVQTTLGPGGRHVAFEIGSGVFTVTKDGVTVAKSIRKLKDPFENVGAQMVRQAAQRTAEVAGDGTTTATILARSIFNEGRKAISAGMNVVDIKKGIEKAVKVCLESVEKSSRPIKTKKELEHVATISTNSDEKLGKMIAAAKHKLGENATITVELGRQAETTIEYVEGMRYEEGYASPYFITNERGAKAELEDAFVMIIDYKIMHINELMVILNKVIESGKPLLIMMNGLTDDVVNILATNNYHKKINVCVTRFPMGFQEDGTELAKDMSALTGATVLGKAAGVDARSCALEHLGYAKKIVVTRNDTTIVGGGGSAEAVETRVAQIKDYKEKIMHIPEAAIAVPYMDERISKLTGGIAVIRAGGATELEMRETKDRIDDAVFAVQAASQEGIVPGGGSVYVKLAKKLATLKGDNTDEHVGVEIVSKALVAPLSQIASNAGFEPTLVVARSKEKANKDLGFNAATGEFEDLIKSGVIDPAKVTKSALKNAASVATLLLTTEAVVATEIVREGDKD